MKNVSIFLLFISMFLNWQTSMADLYQQGFDAGKATCGSTSGPTTTSCPTCPTCPTTTTSCPTCPTCPTTTTSCPTLSCPTCPSDRYQEGYSAGKSTCQTCPPDRYQDGYANGYDDGQHFCQDNPASCGLLTSADVDQATQAGIDEGKRLGKRLCKENPQECFTLAFASSLPEGCDDYGCYSPSHGLYLPSVDYLTGGTLSPLVENVQMDFLIGGVNGSEYLFHFKQGDFIVDTVTLETQVTDGQIVSYPAGIVCDGSADSKCERVYKRDSSVRLFAVPASGLIFSGWSNCGETDIISIENPLNVPLSGGSKCLLAQFSSF